MSGVSPCPVNGLHTTANLVSRSVLDSSFAVWHHVLTMNTRPDNPHVGQPHSINAACTMLENLLMSSDTPGEGATNPQARPTSDKHRRLTSTKVNPSSWIDKVKYKNGFLAVFLKRQDRKDEPVVLLYSNVPSWMCGLIQAGEGGQSIGSAYNSLLKRADVQAKYGIQYQRVEGWDRVRELERMMTQ